MNHRRLKIWAIATFILGISIMIIRSIWQIVVIPDAGTMLMFVSLIVAMLLLGAIFTLLLLRPDKLTSLPFKTGATIALTAGFIAGIVHYIRFIPSPEATPLLSKIIANLLMLLGLSGYSILLYLIWSVMKKKQNGKS